MKDKERLRKLIRIFFILLIVLAVLEFLSIGFNGVGFFTSLRITLPMFWKILSRDVSLHGVRYLWPLLYLAIVGALILLYCAILPFSVLFFSKCRCYFSIGYACLRRHYRFKICRFPFCSLAGVRETPDIKIGMEEKTLYIHFIDIHYASRRIVTFLNEKEYCIQPTNLGRVVFRGGKRSFRRERYRQRRDKIKSIPEFSPKPSEYHVLVLMPRSVTAQVTEGFEKVGVGGETWYRGFMICRARVLKRRLRGELLTPFGPLQQK